VKKRRKKKKPLTKVVELSGEKAKEAIRFLYKHRKKFQEALKLVGAVLGTASMIIVRPEARSTRKRKRKLLKSGRPPKSGLAEIRIARPPRGSQF
jgi:hypothetical protein